MNGILVRTPGWKVRGLIVAVVVSWAAFCRGVDPTWEYAVQISAAVQASPPQISLSWVQDSISTPSNYIVYRKAPGASSWGAGITLAGSVTNFQDANVAVGTAYEYQVVKTTSLGYSGYGYIYSGINVPLVDSRGRIVLIVDNTCTNALVAELARLEQDLAGDGWVVLRHDVGRADSVVSVRNVIKADYNADPADVKAVFLFGHVPVPYSGNFSPDIHIPDHQGAWPADVYYGDMDGVWTDSSVYTTNAADSRNWNVPGDGKFDQSSIPSDVELMVGRVDLANMPGKDVYDGPSTFPSEIELLRQYLNKDHAFRTKMFDLPHRGLIYDGFGDYYGAAFSASGWRNFATFFGPAQIDFLPDPGTWITTLGDNGYLWAYGCGAGAYSSIAGLGYSGQYNLLTTPDLVRTNIQAVFTMLFGSWLGDWDSEDNFQRAVLATPTYGLACCWSGFPHWFCQHMGLGETIGFSTRLTQNNYGTNGLYQTQTNAFARGTHIALMGDPTLRMQVVAPPSGLVGIVNGGMLLGWQASPDPVVGYHVYRCTSPLGPFARLTSSPVSATTFLDSSASASTNTYMVRAVKLETTASGTFFNASQGIFMTTNSPVAQEQVVHIDSISPFLGGYLLHWQGIPGQRYRICYQSSFPGTNWAAFLPDVIALGTSMTWVDPIPGFGGRRFYKVLQLY